MVGFHRKQPKQPWQIGKAYFIVFVINHMKGKGQPPVFTFLLYRKQAAASSGVQFFYKRYFIFFSFKMAKEVKHPRKYFICIHDL